MKMFDVKTTVEPTTDPVTLIEVKTHLAITHTDDDNYLTDLISQVRADVEKFCGISIGSQTKKWVYDFNTCEWNIPYGPVISITSVVRRTGAGTTETLAANEGYELQGELNKTMTVYSGGRCTITYVTGYTTIPEGLKRGILEEITFRYEHRGDEVIGVNDVNKSYLIRYKDFNWD